MLFRSRGRLLENAAESFDADRYGELEDFIQQNDGYAFEARCFVLVAGSVMPRTALPSELEAVGDSELLLRGGSAVIGPDGAYLVEPILDREELLVCDLDLRAVDRERMTLDVTGHYARPDVFQFEVDKSRKESK